MRQALRGLTTRGRSFLAAGVARPRCAPCCSASATCCGSRSCWSRCRWSARSWWPAPATGSRRRAAWSRPAAAVGSDARVVLRLENVSRLPTGLLLLEDRVPYVLGARPRFVLDRVEPRGRARWPTRCAPTCAAATSSARCDPAHRPVRHVRADPLLHRTDTVRRHPASWSSCPPLPLGGDWAGSGESKAAVARVGRRGRRRHPRVPPRRRPAPRALALDRAQAAS